METSYILLCPCIFSDLSDMTSNVSKATECMSSIIKENNLPIKIVTFQEHIRAYATRGLHYYSLILDTLNDFSSFILFTENGYRKMIDWKTLGKEDFEVFGGKELRDRYIYSVAGSEFGLVKIKSPTQIIRFDFYEIYKGLVVCKEDITSIPYTRENFIIWFASLGLIKGKL